MDQARFDRFVSTHDLDAGAPRGDPMKVSECEYDPDHLWHERGGPTCTPVATDTPSAPQDAAAVIAEVRAEHSNTRQWRNGDGTPGSVKCARCHEHAPCRVLALCALAERAEEAEKVMDQAVRQLREEYAHCERMAGEMAQREHQVLARCVALEAALKLVVVANMQGGICAITTDGLIAINEAITIHDAAATPTDARQEGEGQ